MQQFHTPERCLNELLAPQLLQHAIDMNRTQTERVAENFLCHGDDEGLADHAADAAMILIEVHRQVNDALVREHAAVAHDLVDEALLHFRF